MCLNIAIWHSFWVQLSVKGMRGIASLFALEVVKHTYLEAFPFFSCADWRIIGRMDRASSAVFLGVQAPVTIHIRC
jgi:hypothetical protein